MTVGCSAAPGAGGRAHQWRGAGPVCATHGLASRLHAWTLKALEVTLRCWHGDLPLKAGCLLPEVTQQLPDTEPGSQGWAADPHPPAQRCVSWDWYHPTEQLGKQEESWTDARAGRGEPTLDPGSSGRS